MEAFTVAGSALRHAGATPAAAPAPAAEAPLGAGLVAAPAPPSSASVAAAMAAAGSAVLAAGRRTRKTQRERRLARQAAPPRPAAAAAFCGSRAAAPAEVCTSLRAETSVEDGGKAAEGAPASAAIADVVGWYNLQWKGGAFEVCFRPVGTFFCPKFQAPATWQMEGNVIRVDWSKFGKYQLTFDPASKHMEGHAVPENKGDDNNWRKADFVRPLSAEELALIGDGAGSEWNFEWSGGKFPVQFKADGYNHFKCDDFPAHAHWDWDQQKELVTIHWGQYGTYEMKINGVEKTMEGAAKGKPEEWRKAKLLRNLTGNKAVEHCEHH